MWNKALFGFDSRYYGKKSEMRFPSKKHCEKNGSGKVYLPTASAGWLEPAQTRREEKEERNTTTVRTPRPTHLLKNEKDRENDLGMSMEWIRRRPIYTAPSQD